MGVRTGRGEVPSLLCAPPPPPAAVTVTPRTTAANLTAGPWAASRGMLLATRGWGRFSAAPGDHWPAGGRRARRVPRGGAGGTARDRGSQCAQREFTGTMTPTHTGGGAGARHSRGRRGPPPRTLGGKAEASVPRWAPPPVGNTDLAGGQVPWRGPGGASAPPPLRPAGTALATEGKRPGRPQAHEVQQGGRTARARPPCAPGWHEGGPPPSSRAEPAGAGQRSPSRSRGSPGSREPAHSSAVGLLCPHWVRSW